MSNFKYPAVPQTIGRRRMGLPYYYGKMVDAEKLRMRRQLSGIRAAIEGNDIASALAISRESELEYRGLK